VNRGLRLQSNNPIGGTGNYSVTQSGNRPYFAAMFRTLHIRYQSARSLPAPFANFYSLTARPTATGAVEVEFQITFPDREDLDEDELADEGYGRDDDFVWTGRLPDTWRTALGQLTDRTRLLPLDEDALDENDDFFDLDILDGNGTHRQGQPRNADDWAYLAQELIQAAYEAGGREAPFELQFMDLTDPTGDREVNLSASFANRSVAVELIQGRREERKTLPWAELQRIMQVVYAVDFDPDEALPQRPNRDGQYLTLGTDDWYDTTPFPQIGQLFRSL
jgi:hypothetical protein